MALRSSIGHHATLITRCGRARVRLGAPWVSRLPRPTWDANETGAPELLASGCHPVDLLQNNDGVDLVLATSPATSTTSPLSMIANGRGSSVGTQTGACVSGGSSAGVDRCGGRRGSRAKRPRGRAPERGERARRSRSCHSTDLSASASASALRVRVCLPRPLRRRPASASASASRVRVGVGLPRPHRRRPPASASASASRVRIGVGLRVDVGLRVRVDLRVRARPR